MALRERDPVTGKMTTGHDWNGIKELETPIPRIVFFFLAATATFALIYWILMPAWPLGDTYTKGVLGIDQRTTVEASLAEARAQRQDWAGAIEARDYDDIRSDEALMRVVRESGRTLFGDNCAACHGREAQGGKGFPSLTDGSWLWGDDPDIVAETIRVGINSAHPDTRSSQMLAFGRDQMLGRDEIRNVVSYVRSLSHPDIAEQDPDSVAAGAETFAANCSGCHGEDAKGTPELGAPNLTDDFWIYGGDEDTLYRTIFGGRQGHMPTWEGRLSPLDIKILALYALDLGESERDPVETASR